MKRSHSHGIRDVGHRPIPQCKGISPHRTWPKGDAATAMEATSSNLSGVRECNRADRPSRLRVANPQGLKRILTIITALMICLSSIGQSIRYSGSDPADNASVGSIQTITLTFDYSLLEEKYPNVEFGIYSAFDEYYPAELRQGTTVLAQCVRGMLKYSDAIISNDYTFSFDNPVILEEGVEYEIYIPDYSFVACDGVKSYGDYYDQPISIKIIGGKSTQPVLIIESCTPDSATSLESLDVVRWTFNEKVAIAQGAQAKLSIVGDGESITQVPLYIDVDEKTVCADFQNYTLYSSNQYKIEIDRNVISMQSHPEVTFAEISTQYSGASYNYFGYGRISPSNNSEVEYLSRISVPVKLEAGAQYIGRDFKTTACMYKVDGEERTLVADAIECIINEATNGFYINVFDFALEPSSTYQIEVEKDSFHLWSMETQKPLYDTSNETLTLTYTTPAEITPLAVQEFGEVTPVASEPLEKLEAFKVMLAPYEFENTFYYPEFLSFAAEDYNVVSVVDAADNSEVTSFKVDIKWDTDNNYWLENIEPLDVTLFEGRSYEVRVPAGMVGCRYEPIRELTANKAFAVTYNGGYSPNCEFTYSVSGLSDVTTTVAKGSTVTVNVAPVENFKVESVIFNGEDAALSGDSFTTPALDSDEALLEVTFAYDGTVLFDFTTGVEDIADCPFKVWRDDDHIVIKNVTVGADIKVYSVAGVLIADTTATDEVVNISVLPGVYVVVIDGVGLKVKH